VSVLLIANTDRRMTECSTSDSVGDASWVQKAALQLYRRNVPLLHTSRYVTARDSVLRWGEKAWVRGYMFPRYEATLFPRYEAT